MGKLADILGIDATFCVDGVDVTVKRLSFGKVLAFVMDGLRRVGEGGDGPDLQKAAAQCIDDGTIPIVAFDAMLKEASDLDESDVAAIFSRRFSEALPMVEFAMGLDVDDKGPSEKKE